ncbi:MAG: hypothetical protein NT010_11900 [Proteobacteria bacterium]|nr:hypothetical protein [Pseudomonadota bacterium]
MKRIILLTMVLMTVLVSLGGCFWGPGGPGGYDNRGGGGHDDRDGGRDARDGGRDGRGGSHEERR